MKITSNTTLAALGDELRDRRLDLFVKIVPQGFDVTVRGVVRSGTARESTLHTAIDQALRAYEVS